MQQAKNIRMVMLTSEMPEWLRVAIENSKSPESTKAFNHEMKACPSGEKTMDIKLMAT